MAQQAISTQLTALQLEKVAATVALLRQALNDYGTVTYSNSLGAESMVLTDLICTQVPQIDIFSIDTGRLPEETYTLLERVERRYGRRLRLVHPQAEALQAYTSEHGINGFYNGLAERQSCCHIRKIEPFRSAIAGFGAWVTGVRREQSATRATAQTMEFDTANGLHKISPILDWTHDDVWAYIRSHSLPYNRLRAVHACRRARR